MGRLGIILFFSLFRISEDPVLSIIRSDAMKIGIPETYLNEAFSHSKIEIHDSIQCIIEWQTEKRDTFTQTLLVNWVDPEKSSSMSDQKIKFVGTKGRYEGEQKERGLTTVFDDQNFEHINPDFCKAFINEQGLEVWEGYGIESIKTFINDVYEIIYKDKKLIDFEKNRPTFSEALYSTSVLESALKSLSKKSIWIKVKT